MREALEPSALVATDDRVRGRRMAARWPERRLDEPGAPMIDEAAMVASLLGVFAFFRMMRLPDLARVSVHRSDVSSGGRGVPQARRTRKTEVSMKRPMTGWILFASIMLLVVGTLDFFKD